MTFPGEDAWTRLLHTLTSPLTRTIKKPPLPGPLLSGGLGLATGVLDGVGGSS